MSETTAAATEPWIACYQQLAPKLLLFARQWVSSQLDAEDVVQTAFVRFWRKRPDAQPDQYPLLFAAVRSAALDMLRREGRRTARENQYFENETGPTTTLFESTLEQQETSELVEQALRRLPEEQREVVVLRVWGELTFAEIANALDHSINTVTARYRYGIEALRKILKSLTHERV